MPIAKQPSPYGLEQTRFRQGLKEQRQRAVDEYEAKMVAGELRDPYEAEKATRKEQLASEKPPRTPVKAPPRLSDQISVVLYGCAER